MLEYVIKSALCLIVLFSFYKLFMEAEYFHNIKRFYLIGSLIISILLPFITISYYTEVPMGEVGQTAIVNQVSSDSVSELHLWQELLPTILFSIYIIGFLIFGIRFYRNLRDLIKDARTNDQLDKLNYIYVLLGRKIDPYSFFNYIFLNKNDFRNEKISTAVIDHEKAHVDQKHSYDLLFLELLHVVFWFNPIFFLLKRAVKLNHEFLADDSVIKKNINPLEYSNILVQYSSGHHQNSFASPIGHSLIKKRIIMITKSFSPRRLFVRSVIFLPVFAGCIYLFNEDIVAMPNNMKPTADHPVSLTDKFQEKRTITIKVVEENIWLNSNKVQLENFAEELDKITSNWSPEELKKPWFQIDFQNANTQFVERLNAEYRKTNLSEISETEFIAPKPVAPSGTPPPPPPPPVQKRNDNVPAPPSPPAPPISQLDSESKEAANAHRKKAKEWRVMKDVERNKIAEERKRIREIEKELNENKNLDKNARRKMLQDVKRQEAKIQRKMVVVKREQAEIEREHRKMDLDMPAPPNPPSAPDPLESIDELEQEGGSFYLNGKKISAAKAREVVKKKEYSKIDILQTGGPDGKLEISGK
ncbi:M56 family metallopeptidase [Christiangramia sediminis]|uniref:Peptidase M56 domain-containing protein n=1 Tax=Christiangramia sediminis TaxID=2881336 RepID=A0A9X1LHC7_9FLAO|nr:M56 family metallopeptidase [Christiangramia sediminis]MCB7480376.1 hypothetical protein [Christiangramia sediminis]